VDRLYGISDLALPPPSLVECAPTPIVMLVARALRKVVTVLFRVDYAAAHCQPASQLRAGGSPKVRRRRSSRR
jgi:hypothetical protein